MTNRFYPGQDDYIEKLNELDDAVVAAEASATASAVTATAAAAQSLTLANLILIGF